MIKRNSQSHMSEILKYVSDNRLLYLLPILVLILVDVFFYTISSDIRIFGILIIFRYVVKRFKLTSTTTFLFALVLLLLTYLEYVFSDPAVYNQPVVPIPEKLAVWLYLFLVIGVIQKWMEK